MKKTPKEEREERMMMNPNFLQEIIDSLPIPIFYRDINGVYQGCNKAHEKFIGLSKSELIGKTVYDVQPRHIADIYSKRDQELLEMPGEQIYETKFRYADGSMHNVVFNKDVFTNSDGTIAGIVGSIFDITKRKRTERKLKKAQEGKEMAHALLRKLRAGIVIVDENLKIIESNEGFAKLLGEEAELLYEAQPGLAGADLAELVPFHKLFSSILYAGENMLERDVRFENKLLNVSINTIQKHKIVGAIIRDMSEPAIRKEEIKNRAKEVNRKNFETVQKIAYLLGENASQTEDMLNSIIEVYNYDD